VKNKLADYLWGEKACLRYVALVSALLIFVMLGAHSIWTQENRWANIVSNMFYTGDYLHPYLMQHNYYDKPLLSYWLIVICVKMTHIFNTFVLRLPNAIAGFASLFAVFGLGKRLFNQRVGFIATWLYLSSFGFMFWTRVASADMLNVAGIVIAVWWYQCIKAHPTFRRYLVFFVIAALAALCKGLVAFVCIALFIFPDWIRGKRWAIDLNVKMFASLLVGIGLYILPYWLSAYFNGNDYHQSGLMLVYQENIVRYFNAFDHKGPISTYFIFLPYYLLPWFFFFIPALIADCRAWKKVSESSRWLWLGLLLNFVFFCISESRRNYYILPLLPFSVLVLSSWLERWMVTVKREKVVACIVTFFLVVYALMYWMFIPLAYSGGGAQLFGNKVRLTAQQQRPWSEWNVVVLNAKMQDVFYLKAAKRPYYASEDISRDDDVLEVFERIIEKNDGATLFVSNADTYAALSNQLSDYTVVAMQPPLYKRLGGAQQGHAIALIPNKSTNKVRELIAN
jgi:4-amino-4-deoxy-L-arabinose transferase-like glycosyltransferase